MNQGAAAMQKWYQIFPRNTGLSLYIWLAFVILPFYFIFRYPTTGHIISGSLLVAVFFLCFRLTYAGRGWQLYTGTSIQIAVSTVMTIYFHYPYFSFFLAVFIGNTRSWGGFLSLYIVHLVCTIGAVYAAIALGNTYFISQAPFILVCMIGVAVLPFNRYNSLKQVKLQGQLEDANRRIADLLVHEERQRIALDLHDTLGQQLSLIRLKSDLAGKLLDKDPVRARSEMSDVHQTARIALQEVREMVSHMRGARLEDEIQRIRQILNAAEIRFEVEGDARLSHTSRLTENVLSMCIKEAVTNVVKHSSAAACSLSIEQLPELLIVKVKDDGTGIKNLRKLERGNGLQGMKERLEFINGSLEISGERGMELTMTVPHNVSRTEEEAEG
jgi:two-component system sensor histidine kinase DesK